MHLYCSVLTQSLFRWSEVSLVDFLVYGEALSFMDKYK